MGKYVRTTDRHCEKKIPAASEVFCEDDPLLKKALDYFNIGRTYELPDVCYGAGLEKTELLFEFVGTVGNNTKLQFREIHGGWTVTFAPVQLDRVIWHMKLGGRKHDDA